MVESSNQSAQKWQLSRPGFGAWRHVCQSRLNSIIHNTSSRAEKRLVHGRMANRGYDVVVDVDEAVSQLFNMIFNPWMLTSPRAT